MNEKLFRSFKADYDASKFYVSNAYNAEEEENVPLATEQYTHAKECLQKIVNFQVNELYGENLASAQHMQSEMFPVLQRVQSKLSTLIETSAPLMPTAPDYSILSDEQLHYSIPVSCDAEFDDIENEYLTETLNEAENIAMENISSDPPQDARELLCIPGGVQLYVVDCYMQVSAAPPTYPTSLRVFAFEDDEEGSRQSRPPAFIQVGGWMYPLQYDQTPVLKCSNGAYMFPLVTADGDSPQSYIGVVISSSIAPHYTEIFSDILANMACLQVQEERLEGEPDVNLSDSVNYNPDEDKEVPMSTKIVSGIETGANWLSWGLSKSAQFTSSLIKKGSNCLQNNISPNETPSTVNPTLKKGLYYSHEASKVTVKVSAALIDGLKFVTGKVAEAVTPHITSYTKSLLLPSSSVGNSNKSRGSSSGNYKSIMKVAGAGIHGFGTVWTGMEKAGMAIACSISEATVDTIQHKYGAEVGESTSHVMGAAVNYGRTVFNIDNIGIKALVKRTAKDTGKAMLKDFYHVKKSPQ